jgi:hypothetical protein
VSATFRRTVLAAGEQTLTVDYNGFGSQRLTSTPTGIDCPGTCSASFPSGSLVTLRGLAHWDGACVGVSSACTLFVDAPTDVLARLSFRAPPPGGGANCCVGGYGLNVTVAGRGQVVDGHTINCGATTGGKSDCSVVARPGAHVLLRALPQSRFVQWGGTCQNYRTPTCRLSLIGPQNVTARFRRH